MEVEMEIEAVRWCGWAQAAGPAKAGGGRRGTRVVAHPARRSERHGRRGGFVWRRSSRSQHVPPCITGEGEGGRGRGRERARAGHTGRGPGDGEGDSEGRRSSGRRWYMKVVHAGEGNRARAKGGRGRGSRARSIEVPAVAAVVEREAEVQVRPPNASAQREPQQPQHHQQSRVRAGAVPRPVGSFERGGGGPRRHDPTAAGESDVLEERVRRRDLEVD